MSKHPQSTTENTSGGLAEGVMTGAIAFVIAVRLVIHGVGFVVGTMIQSVAGLFPDPEPREFPRLERLQTWMVANLASVSPSWVERRGSYVLKLNTTRGSESLDSIVDRIPAPLFSAWAYFGIALMLVLTAVWAVVLVGLLGIGTQWYAGFLQEQLAVLWTLDWVSLFQTPPRQQVDLLGALRTFIYSIPQILYSLASLVLALALTTVLMWGIFALFLPGLVLHEFGHYAALRDSDAAVEQYGVFLLGPLPGGAFVEPGDELETLPTDDLFRMWAGGVANTMLWATALVGVGLALTPAPVETVTAFIGNPAQAVSMRPVASILLAVGVFESVNGFLNAIPLSRVDGGGFVRTAEDRWLGFEESASFPEKVTHLVDGIQTGMESNKVFTKDD